jgi:hypothetical protein
MGAVLARDGAGRRFRRAAAAIHIHRSDTSMKPSILLRALPLALLAACSESPSGPDEAADDSGITLTYTGGVSGTFAAEGDPSLTSVPNTQTFAIGHHYPEGRFEVIAYRQRGGSRFDVATVTLPAAAVGQAVAIDRLCAADVCPDVTIGLDLGQANGSVATHTCKLETGTIRITALSATRASGTVSGSGACNPGSGGDGVPFQITAGTFAVDVMQH